MKRVYSQRYPHSLGIWYSAMTQRIGLKPNEDEYILMGMAAVGDPEKYKQVIYEDFFEELSLYDPEDRLDSNTICIVGVVGGVLSLTQYKT